MWAKSDTWAGPAGPITGRVIGIDATGRLQLETAEGVVACETGEWDAEVAT